LNDLDHFAALACPTIKPAFNAKLHRRLSRALAHAVDVAQAPIGFLEKIRHSSQYLSASAGY
jgi:hypothetical protein